MTGICEFCEKEIKFKDKIGEAKKELDETFAKLLGGSKVYCRR